MAKINFKLNLLLNSFSKTELEHFRQFVSFPLFTNGRNYAPILDYVMDNKENTNKVSKPAKIKSTGKGKKLSDQTLKNRCSELYKLGEDFLIFMGLSENKEEREKILLKKLSEKKLFKTFESKQRKFTQMLQLEKFDVLKLKNLTDLSEILTEYLSENNKVSILYNEYFDYSKLVFCYNLIELFQINFEFVQQELHNIKYEPNYVSDHLKNLDLGNTMNEFKGSDSPVFKVAAMNYYLFKAYGKDNDGKLYSDSHKIFTELIPDLSDRYKIYIFRVMINLCIMKINKGELIYRDKLFSLYNEKLELNLITDLENNAYTFNNFRDYVYIGITIKKYKWVENFIKKYSGNLPADIRTSETNLSFAKLDFEKKNFRRSLENLKSVKASHYLQYIDTSLLSLCNYYELKLIEEAYLEIDKQIHYLKNHEEIPVIQQKYVFNYIKIYKKMVRYITEPLKEDPGLIESEFKKYKLIAKRSWLQDKISELRNGTILEITN